MDKTKIIKNLSIFLLILYTIIVSILSVKNYYVINNMQNQIKEVDNKTQMYEKELYKIVEENRKKREFIEKEKKDLNTDNSIKRFVSANISFNIKSYIPDNLVVVSSIYVYDSKGGASTLRKEAKENLDLLAEAFISEFGKKLTVVSAYRDYERQVRIKAGGCPDNLCAKAGYSEHQTGLTVDLFSASTESTWKNSSVLWSYYEWLDKNAAKYGFHNTYQKGLEIDTYEIEPWHWRYLGVDLATELKQKDMTFAEYYNFMMNK